MEKKKPTYANFLMWLSYHFHNKKVLILGGFTCISILRSRNWDEDILLEMFRCDSYIMLKISFVISDSTFRVL